MIFSALYRLFSHFVLLSIVLTSHAKANHNNALSASIQQSDLAIIAHRGASGFLPEHTKASVVLAYMQGADYIEQDLVLSKDDKLLVLHDVYLDEVTNVNVIFPGRARKDKRFYAIDFTLDELRQLTVNERKNADGELRFPKRYRGKANFRISTFEEHVELVRELNRQFGKDVGWYPEIKSYAWHVKQGKNIADIFVDELNRLALNYADANVFVQSFEPDSLKYLRHERKIKTPLIQLIGEDSWHSGSFSYTDMRSIKGLARVATYADGIGPWLPQVYDEQRQQVRPFLAKAKAAGLLVHPFTHREDAKHLSDWLKKRYFALKSAGIDGIFTDQIMPYMLED